MDHNFNNLDREFHNYYRHACIFLKICIAVEKNLLGHLSHSGDLLLWVGVRHRASFVVRRALTSSSQELLGQS